jgi:hypothetical protein
MPEPPRSNLILRGPDLANLEQHADLHAASTSRRTRQRAGARRSAANVHVNDGASEG